MKQITKLTLIFAAAISMAACTKSNKENTVKGIIYDATMNTVVVINNNDTLAFSTIDADKSQVNGMLIGDTAIVTYKGDLVKGAGAATPATKLVVKPAPRKDAIIGAWIQPIEGMDGVQGVEIKEDGTASSINMSTLTYEKWQKNGDILIFAGKSIGNGQTLDFSDTMKISKNDADSLIIVNNAGTIFRYSKQQ